MNSDIVTQDMDDVGAWNTATGVWRVGGARPQEMKGDNTWRWLWDSVPDHFIGPTPASFITFDKDGNDISLRSGGVLHDYGSVDFHSSGIVQDGRNAYVYDQTHGALYRFSLDGGQPFTLVNVLSLPDITWTVAGRGITIVWHPVLRAVIILGYGSDFKGRMYAFEVDTNKLTGWPRADGFVTGAGTGIASHVILRSRQHRHHQRWHDGLGYRDSIQRLLARKDHYLNRAIPWVALREREYARRTSHSRRPNTASSVSRRTVARADSAASTR